MTVGICPQTYGLTWNMNKLMPSICKMHESSSLEIFITNYLSHVITFHEDYLGFTVMFDFDRHFGGGFLCIKVTPELGWLT